MSDTLHTSDLRSPTGDRFLVVLPTYNELETIVRVVQRIGGIRGLAAFPGDVLIVDDNSPDGTGEAANRLADQLSWVTVMHRPRKLGLAQAYVAGFKWGLARGYTHIIEMDADLSHAPEAIVRLVSAVADADLVVGSRYVAGGAVVGWTTRRRAISRAGCVYGRRLLGLDVRDVTSGFKCFHRRVLESIDLDSVGSDGYVFQIELTYRAARMGASVVEIPISFADRTGGQSKMTWGIVLEAVWRVPWLRLRPPSDPPLPVSESGALALAA